MSEDILTAINSGNFSEKEIRLAFSRIPSQELVKQLDFFITFQGKGHSLRSLTRKWALSIDPKHLSEKLEGLIRYQESEDEDIRSLARDLAEKISEEVLLENIAMLLQYQDFDDEDVRILSRDLALKIDPGKLMKVLPLIECILEGSKSQDTFHLADKLIINAKGSIEEGNVKMIMSLITA